MVSGIPGKLVHMRFEAQRYRCEVRQANETFVGEVFELDVWLCTITAESAVELRERFSEYIASPDSLED